MVVCNHCVILISQFTLANACRTLRAHLSTAILRKIGSLEACEIRHMHDALFHALKIPGLGYVLLVHLQIHNFQCLKVLM